MPIRINGGVFNQQVLTGSLSHYILYGADFSGALNANGQPVPGSAAEIIFTKVEAGAYIDIMNPNKNNISFALESDRSIWDENTLTVMVRSLGTNVGVDHVDCSLCTVESVSYEWGAPVLYGFISLTDTPKTYAGAAGYQVTVNQAETGLIFTPGAANYIPVGPGALLSISREYFVTATGSITLPGILGAGFNAGQAITIAKAVGATVTINLGYIGDVIATDLGNTDSIIFNASQELVFVTDGVSIWNLQIGSRL